MQMLLAPLKFPNMKFLQPIGLSGGLALLWKNGFICNVVSCKDNIIHAAVQRDPSQPELLLSCMYGYCDYSKKKVQRDFIKDIRLNISQPWVLLGDLNFHILDYSSSTSSSGDGLVNSIIQEVGLQDLSSIGREHTWSNNDLGTGKNISRLDMAFTNGSWSLHFQDSKLLHLTQNGSDHCHVMLVTDYSQPKLWKPFKFFQTWIQDRTCAAEITKAWEKSVQGSPRYKLIKRLQFTRITLYKWNKTNFGNIYHNVDNLQQKLSAIQAMPFSPDNTSKALEVSQELDNWHKIQHEFYRQKSRDNFVKDMYYNTKYFHTLTKSKRAINNIDSLKTDDGTWLQSREEDNSLLLLPSSDEEIHKVLKSVESWSAPGPEVFQAGFYKSQCNIVGSDVCDMVKNFLPIGICNTSYKILSKILVSRMKPLMERIISPYQAAYVSGRLINDNTIIVHEVIHSMKRKEGEGGWLALKLDMSKSFDILEWSFLLENSHLLGELDKDTLFLLIFSSLQWNGSLDLEAHNSKEIIGISIARGAPPLNHLLFADDCLIFTQENLTSVNNLLQVLKDFSSQSSQVINFDKSSVLYSTNMNLSVCNTLSNILGVQCMEENEKYLGSTLIIDRSKVKAFKDIQLAFERRLGIGKELIYIRLEEYNG
ncbi:uncharacterized protein LOC113359344 [Papaver somniferum]|uniref:uncharacterized protein LOC113359344 n=1 Tax=Papaver somniferum TaxID=3469 RepID=UPI000E701415|nr:uncharacterized protein LOC113359344 [Papaver somniferum]